ncbi:MAG: hypothetical protein H0T66_17300 [Geodermatophilaceae bacterium]|nr:hypothetical protein [Geodermatophilaceae bacterium]MDQ3454728.1 hypothetical protein [Actinomycetota bacterium]
MSYRIWPALAVAALGVVGATTVVVTSVRSDPGADCAAGRDWVAVVPWDAPERGDDAVLVDYGQRMQPLFRACLDVTDLPVVDPAEVPDPRS